MKCTLHEYFTTNSEEAISSVETCCLLNKFIIVERRGKAMKKRCVAALALAAMLAVQPMTAFAAGSSSTNAGGTNAAGSTKNDTTVSVSSTGVKTTGATTSASSNGSTIGVAVDTVTTTGQPVTVNSKGEAVVGDVAVGFAKEGSATAGLPANVVSAIEGINSGKALNEVVQGVDVNGYNALTGTHAIVTKDAATGTVKDTQAEVSLYVPNLVDGLGNVQVLFYNNVTGQWILLPTLKVDPVSKTVAVNIPGSGTLSVVYRK